MPFIYKVRVTSPVIGDYIDVTLSPIGEFQLQRTTKTRAFYRLVNMYQAKEL